MAWGFVLCFFAGCEREAANPVTGPIDTTKTRPVTAWFFDQGVDSFVRGEPFGIPSRAIRSYRIRKSADSSLQCVDDTCKWVRGEIRDSILVPDWGRLDSARIEAGIRFGYFSADNESASVRLEIATYQDTGTVQAIAARLDGGALIAPGESRSIRVSFTVAMGRTLRLAGETGSGEKFRIGVGMPVYPGWSYSDSLIREPAGGFWSPLQGTWKTIGNTTICGSGGIHISRDTNTSWAQPSAPVRMRISGTEGYLLGVGRDSATVFRLGSGGIELGYPPFVPTNSWTEWKPAPRYERMGDTLMVMIPHNVNPYCSNTYFLIRESDPIVP